MDNILTDSVKNFIKNYFNEIPIQPKWIDDQTDVISNLKKDIVDLYFHTMKRETLYFNRFFYNLLNYKNESLSDSFDKKRYFIPLVNVWQNKFINLLYKFNKKPSKILFVINEDDIPDFVIQYIQNLDLTILDENFIEPIKISLSEKKVFRLEVFENFEILKFNYSLNELFPINQPFNNIIIITHQINKTFVPEELFFLNEVSKTNSIYFLLVQSQASNDVLMDDFKLYLQKSGIPIERCYLLSKNILPYNQSRIITQFNDKQPPFFEDIFSFSPIKLDKIQIDDIFFEISNMLKNYADLLISDLKYHNESNFFFLESLRFSKKAMDIKAEYARELEKKAEWEKVIDELAHSLNTNIGAARDSILSISLESSDDNIIQYSEEAENFMREAAELVDLTLDSLKVEINKNHISMVNLSDMIHLQLKIIKKGINTLRFSTNTHLENVKNMLIHFSLDDSIRIGTYASAANLIVKDLLKNALLNTKQDKPEVSITSNIINNESCLLSITNNKAISKEWAEWINFDIEREEIRMSKSRRVGMRVVKRWKPKLKWQIFVSSDEKNNFTTTTVTIPFIWK